MKVFRVITEHDGETYNDHGDRKTEVVRSNHIYISENMKQVFSESAWLKDSYGREIIAIIEEYPSCTILKPEEE